MASASFLIYGRPSAARQSKNFMHFFRNLLRKSNSRLLGLASRQSLTFWFKTTGRIPNGTHRSIASAMQPLDPLRFHPSLPEIDVVIPFIPRDISVLPHSVEGVLRYTRNPIGKLRLITPKAETIAGSDLMVIQRLSPLITLEHDEDVLGEGIFAIARDKMVPLSPGWHLQQILKFLAVRNSSATSTLILDADTVLLTEKTWVTQTGVQTLQFSEEYNHGYKAHSIEHFRLSRVLPISFITHHQLMQRDVVTKMFPTDESLIEWYKTAVTSNTMRLSEYESYGSYIWDKFPRRVRFSTWSNLWSPKFEEFDRDLDATGLTPGALIKDYCSVSFHAHSQVPGFLKQANPADDQTGE